MELPKPRVVFTLPSVHDDTPLACRIYKPNASRNPTSIHHAAIIAHPYAPLGGSYDDLVVQNVGSELLNSGWTVATFNFRGASGSHGRTSWTGKPEVDDYVTVAGFVIFYLQHLLGGQNTAQKPELDINSPHASGRDTICQSSIRLILAGYSYGSHIVMHLPPVPAIIARFTSPLEGSPAAEVLLRAQHMAAEDLASHEPAPPLDTAEASDSSHPAHMLLSVGGDESEATEARHEAHGHEKRLRHKASSLSERIRSIRHKEKEGHSTDHSGSNVPRAQVSSPTPTVVESYLLISPILPPMSSVVAVSLRNPNLEKFSQHTTLAVFGDDDAFTSIRKLRDWAAERSRSEGSKFRSVVVNTGGHFWIDPTHSKELREAVGQWAASIQGDDIHVTGVCQ